MSLSLPCSRRVSLPLSPDAGACSRRLAWWGPADWLREVSTAVWTIGRDLCRTHHVDPDTVVAVARAHAAFADYRTGRDCRPGNEKLLEVARVSLSTVKRARRVLRELELLAELLRGRNFMSRSERLAAWRSGSSHRRIASVFALCSLRRRPRSVGPKRSALEGEIAPQDPQRPSSGVERGPLPAAGELEGESPLPAWSSSGQTDDQERFAHSQPRTAKRPVPPGPDPATRRLTAAVQRRLRWTAAVHPRRLSPTLSRFARAGWGPRDVEDAVRDSLAARGWRMPRELTQPAAYLALLLRETDPADRPGRIAEELAAAEAAQRAYELRRVYGAPCAHGMPAGSEPSPLRGILACPECRREAEEAVTW